MGLGNRIRQINKINLDIFLVALGLLSFLGWCLENSHMESLLLLPLETKGRHGKYITLPGFVKKYCYLRFREVEYGSSIF